MHYHPSKTSNQDLIDIDDLQDASITPESAPEDDKPKKVKGPSAFNPKVNKALPNITIWMSMALISWMVLPYAAVPLEAVGSFSQKVIMAGAGGFGLGGMLMWKANKTGNHTPYGNTHMFFFISLALALTGWLPSSLTFSLLGPLLVGFGVGSFLTVLALGVRTPPKSKDLPEIEPSVGEV